MPGSESEEDTYDEEMDDIKKDLLLGHLLAKVARSEQHHQQQTHVLPTLASSLTELQLLPRCSPWPFSTVCQVAFSHRMLAILWRGHYWSQYMLVLDRNLPLLHSPVPVQMDSVVVDSTPQAVPKSLQEGDVRGNLLSAMFALGFHELSRQQKWIR